MCRPPTRAARRWPNAPASRSPCCTPSPPPRPSSPGNFASCAGPPSAAGCARRPRTRPLRSTCGGAATPSARLPRLVGQDLLAAGAALHRIGVDGDGIVWLTECGLMPRDSVADLIAQGRGTGLPVLAATTSGPAAAQLAELTNVVVMHRMAAAAAARQLATAAAAAGA